MNKKINVLNVIGALNTGGAETMLVNILRTINQNKFNVFFLCYSNEKYDYEDEINKLGGTILRMRNRGIIHNIIAIKHIIKKNKIDVVHCHTYYNSVFAVIAARLSRIKTIIVHSHNTKAGVGEKKKKKVYYSISKSIINRFATHFVACGDLAGRAMFYKTNKFWIFHNGILPNEFKYSSKNRKEIRKELGIGDKDIVIGHVGRFSEQKNHSFMIDIFREFCKEHKNSVLILVGQGHLQQEIKQKTIDYGIEKNVRFVGLRKDTNKIYSAMDAMILPSLYEGLPLVLIEAQASGLPIIASDTIDRSVDITNTIRFVSLNDSIKKWCDTMEECVGKRYADNYEIVVRSDYSMPSEVKKLEKIYSEKGSK